MGNITAPDLSTAAQAAANKSTAELDDAYGHAGNGLVHLYEDPSVPQHQKINFFRAVGDRFFRGVLDTVATMTGQSDARLALEGGDAPDPVLAPPAPPQATPAELAELNALRAEANAIDAWINANKDASTPRTGNLVTDIGAVVRSKETAAAILPADTLKKAPLKANITAALAAANASKDEGGFHQSGVPGSTAMVISKAKYDEMVAELKKIETATA